MNSMNSMVEGMPMVDEEQLDLLLQAVQGAGRVLILPHNDPDPDAIASAFALRHLLAQKLDVKGEIVYRGIVGRAENKALVRYLEYPLRPLLESDLRRSTPVALVDTQPGAGNNSLPADVPVAIVFDHHPARAGTAAATFADVRSDLGATSTLLLEYLRVAGVELPGRIATALFYGIKTDTMGLARGAGREDIAAYFYLLPRLDVDALTDIEHAQVPAGYFESLVATLQAARVYDRAVISYMGKMSRPDLAAEMADLLLRLEGTWWVICLGVYENLLILSVRTWSREKSAGEMIRVVVDGLGTAGGHGAMAGGQVPLDGKDPDTLAQTLIKRTLQYLGLTPEAKDGPLI